MKLSFLSSLVLCISLVLSSTTSSACRHAPPNLTPEAAKAWYGIQVIHDLDLLRDIAIDANNQMPPLVSTDDTRVIVEYHQSALKIVKSAQVSWKLAVGSGLDEAVNKLSPTTKDLIRPYVGLIKTILSEIP